MRLGHRSERRVLGAPLHGSHYRAAFGMAKRYPLSDLPANARRFLVAWGSINEIFCREDYRCGRDLRVAVDIGANIGISALYFLTRNADTRVYAFEPDPRNVERLRINLATYCDRYHLEEVAIDTSDGVARFASDPYRRYGTLAYGGDTWYEPTFIDVQVRSINGALAGILERESEIDILKIDTEGLEERLVGVLDEELLRRIRTIVYETDDPAPYHTARFRHSFACETNRLEFR